MQITIKVIDVHSRLKVDAMNPDTLKGKGRR
jgi:hypothetical protein